MSNYATPGAIATAGLNDFPAYSTADNGKVLSVVDGALALSTASAPAAAWGQVTGTLSAQTDLDTALGLKAPAANPTFTGTVATATVTVSTSIAFPTFTVATVPAATTAGKIIYVSDGNAGGKTMAFSDGTNWINVLTGTAVASS